MLPEMPQDKPYHPAIHGLFALAVAAGGTLEELFVGLPSTKELAYKTTLGLHATFGDYALAIGAGLLIPAVVAWMAISEVRAATRAYQLGKLEAIAQNTQIR